MFSLFRAETPQLYVDIDRTKCEAVEVDVSEVFITLQVYMGGYFVNLFNKFGRTWQVNVLAEPRFRTQPDYVKQLKGRSLNGQMVPLATLSTVEDVVRAFMVLRYNTYTSPAATRHTAPGTTSRE